jgi:hypothetical protein
MKEKARQEKEGLHSVAEKREKRRRGEREREREGEGEGTDETVSSSTRMSQAKAGQRITWPAAAHKSTQKQRAKRGKESKAKQSAVHPPPLS